MLFAPPSVKGWDGGPAWLNGQTLLFRQNLALALTSTEDARFGRRSDPAALLAEARQARPTREVVDFFLDLFLQGDVPADARERSCSTTWTDREGREVPGRTGPPTTPPNHRVRAVAPPGADAAGVPVGLSIDHRWHR